MSKPRDGWWGYAKWIVRVYPQRKREYEQIHEQSITANITGMPGSGQVSRGTEDIAIKEADQLERMFYRHCSREQEDRYPQRTQGEVYKRVPFGIRYGKGKRDTHGTPAQRG